MLKVKGFMFQEEIESFKCSCDQGYEGYACDQLVDHCSDFPCDNGGNCTSDLVSYTCSCPTGKTQFLSPFEPRHVCDFQQKCILTSVDSDKPVQPPFKLSNFK